MFHRSFVSLTRAAESTEIIFFSFVIDPAEIRGTFRTTANENQSACGKKPDIAFPKGCCFFFSALSAEKKKKENTLRAQRLCGEIVFGQ
jgi:hypothetical protein